MKFIKMIIIERDIGGYIIHPLHNDRKRFTHKFQLFIISMKF